MKNITLMLLTALWIASAGSAQAVTRIYTFTITDFTILSPPGPPPPVDPVVGVIAVTSSFPQDNAVVAGGVDILSLNIDLNPSFGLAHRSTATGGLQIGTTDSSFGATSLLEDDFFISILDAETSMPSLSSFSYSQDEQLGVGYQSTTGAVSVAAAAVPLPAPAVLLAFAIAALIGSSAYRRPRSVSSPGTEAMS